MCVAEWNLFNIVWMSTKIWSISKYNILESIINPVTHPVTLSHVEAVS